MINASKSLGTLLVLIGTILFFIVCGEFIWRMILAMASLYVISYGLQLRGSAPLSMSIGMWSSKLWGSAPRSHR